MPKGNPLGYLKKIFCSPKDHKVPVNTPSRKAHLGYPHTMSGKRKKSGSSRKY